MRNTTTAMMGAGLVMAVVLATGCQNTREGVERDAENAAARSEQAAERTAETGREVGREVGQAAGQAADATRDAAGHVAETTRDAAGTAANVGDAAQQTAQIKSALMADASIDASSIDVDTEASTKTVTLKGTVRSAAEKATAARVATDKAPGYRVVNNLEVRR